MHDQAWSERQMAGAYREIEHAADLLIEVRGRNLSELLEHALYALYDNLVDLAQVRPAEERLLVVQAEDAADALRRLLQEALVTFSTEGFLAAGAEVLLDGENRVRARLHGETLERSRHSLESEIKAATYHQLTAVRSDDGSWTATVLLDV